MSFRKTVLSSALLTVLALVALGGPAVAKPKPPGPTAPVILTGTVTGSITYSHGGTGVNSSNRWRISGLKLKRGAAEKRGNGWRRVYKIVGGTVTWTFELTGGCPYAGGGLDAGFTETFSLKGVRWDVDSRITFFVSTKGRFKNRWFVDGSIDVRREKALGTCGDTEVFATLPSLFSGLKVRDRQRTTPGKKVRLTHNRRYQGDDGFGHAVVEDKKNTLTINAG